MRPDTSAALHEAARRRSERTRAKAIEALRRLDHAGNPITFEAVARAAGVSRSWLYDQADLREEIQRIREVINRPKSARVPARQRSSDASLIARLQIALEKNRKLTEENQRLRRQLARALGDQRAASRSGHEPTSSLPNVAIQ